MKSRQLNILVKDETSITDKLHTYKKWFNGMHHFFTVKVLPKKK